MDEEEGGVHEAKIKESVESGEFAVFGLHENYHASSSPKAERAREGREGPDVF